MENRKRNVHLHVMVTPDELAAIHERMAEAGISNAGAYVRKMALNGYILHIDLAPVKELISLQRRCSNNLNQVAIDVYKRQVLAGGGIGYYFKIYKPKHEAPDLEDDYCEYEDGELEEIAEEPEDEDTPLWEEDTEE